MKDGVNMKCLKIGEDTSILNVTCRMIFSTFLKKVIFLEKIPSFKNFDQ